MHPMLNIAIRAARSAGNLIVRYLERVDRLNVTQKSYNEFVTEVDQQAEDIIVEVLRRAYPQHGILGEEGGMRQGDDYTWVIDPLDGTTNFLHGFPQFSVSIALKHRDRLSQAVVYDPLRNELFTATQGEGAQLNERRIRVSRCHHLREALLGTGFPYRFVVDVDAYLAIFRDLIVSTAGVRRPGSAALDLAYVAAGRLDGFWEFGLKEWDMAAGSLLIQEAGGMVGDPEGGDRYLRRGDIVTGNPKIYQALIETIRPHLARLTADRGAPAG
ncbi:MAG: inositol monophosphatase family protein [Gammaproteobacteria bacterium]